MKLLELRWFIRARHVSALAYGRMLSAFRGIANCLNGAYLIATERKEISSAQVFVVLEEGGFGHTLTTVDLARRLFPEKRITFLFFSTKGRYNKYANNIWPEHLHIILFELEHTAFWYAVVPRLAAMWCRRLLNKQAIAFWRLAELHKLAENLTDARGLDFPERMNVSWVTGYFRLIESFKNFEKPSLGDNLSQEVINALGLTGKEKLATFYIRNKGGDVTTESRNGSSVSTYMKSFRMLVDLDYTVCITGDISSVDSAFIHPGRILSKQSACEVGIDGDLFQIYVVMNAAICISESGGGAWLPMILEKPHLCINSFPYWYAMKNAWVYPKNVRNGEGIRMGLDVLYDSLIYEYSVGIGMTLENNNSDEVLQAITEFINEVKLANKPTSKERFIPNKVSWFDYSEAKILQCWLEDKVRMRNDSPRLMR